MTRVASVEEWERLARAVAVEEATRLRDDATFRTATRELASRNEGAAPFTGEAYEQLLLIDALSRRLQSFALPALTESMSVMSARERIICTNATRFTLEALMSVGLVDDAAVIAACRDSSARLRLATLGMSRTLPSGRLDLAARRRFDVPRDAALCPLVLPPRPLPTIAGETAVLKFLLDEAEHEWIRMVPSSDHRVSMMPRFALSHRDARLVTGWSAAALDSRLARGVRWDSVLDAARVDRTGAERGAVVFDPLRFMLWWKSLAN
jgi:hypothetical protein